MPKRPLLTALFAFILLAGTALNGFLNNEHVQASLFNKPIEVVRGTIYSAPTRVNPEAHDAVPMKDNVLLGKFGDWSYCRYEKPENPQYNVDLRYVTINDSIYEEANILPGEAFTVDMVFENTGNTRLYARGQCFNQAEINIGTQMQMDRISRFGDWEHALAGWSEPTRILMAEAYVEPGELAHFTFTSRAPAGDNIYREFFQPVVEGVAWVDEIFALDFEVGAPTESMKDNIRFVSDISVDAAALEGKQKNLAIHLASQTMFAKFGDLVVWSMDISSGAYATPTPRGNYKIFQKQELRIGQKAPYYHMPWWQFWDARGYGIHGLPYLANDGGSFWKEADNHIGIPVSHGCIRTLDRDAETLYQFTEIGTPVKIY